MLVSSIVAILGASTFAAATSAPPSITPFLTASGAVPTTLVPITKPISASSGLTFTLSSNSSSSARPSTITSRIGATRTITIRPAKTNSYEACGGLRATPKPCPASFECISDPFVKGCGLACDQLGICVVPIMCGGIAAIKCPAGKFCVDDPRDDCHPSKNGADCAGLCV
ncbi:uncharacterized protein ColSpa_06428 [Colletotrichum spaethianum]|uniref:Uncharacterized protein n=1 Tax=Colletotrichum spaethianum TaxID=700344 RepID=A0AA37LD10_9PEZI|nr:uncharacterized protein ColSpa_06428 [Colletotrichum spaethianum]GKT46247.1 hypothetical protein ColSpa_06428 [Colletotrichum spaethianum]